ncbi:MAG: PfkB family carbohydrate kinase [Planctomycetota bacterium]|nr:PfkB family carbohydrate kinase [Planctomycetota bacterium]
MEPSAGVRSKMLSRQELLSLRDAARADGRTVVQCHGCFDIVHPGHVRHLQHAARQADILLVTITADSVMSKGVGRPLIPQELRAENLAALDCVDWVYVNPAATALELLEEVKPDVYVKGREYETNEDPRFRAEREAVERSGGRVVFSSGDVVFSSTALVAAMETSADPAHARIRQLIAQHDLTLEKLEPIVEGFIGLPVVVVGETIVDTYVHCDRPDIAGESPVMSLRPLEHRSYDGGAAVIARHLAALGARPTLVTALPRTPAAEGLRQRLAVEGIEVRAVECDGPMLEKQRFLVGTQKVMKLDMVRPVTLDAGRQHDLLGLAGEAARGARAAIIADFGNGLLTSGMLSKLCPILRQRVDFLAGDVSGRRASLAHMRDMDLLTPTENELRDAVRDYDDSLNAAVWRLLAATGSQCAFVTMGAEGLIAFERLPEPAGDAAWSTRVRGEHVPALTPHALDPLGCGDALLATATLTLASAPALTDSLAIAGFLASIAAGAHAARLGNDPVSARDLRTGLRRLCDSKLSVVTSRPGVRLVV